MKLSRLKGAFNSSRCNRVLPSALSLLLTSSILSGAAPGSAERINDRALQQIRTLHQEKGSRTPAQRKLDSQLVYAARRARGEAIAAGVPTLVPDLKVQTDGKVLVDMNARVSPALLTVITQNGGEVINSFPQYGSIRALVTVDQIESLAARDDVSFIRPADEATTNVGRDTSEGDVTHACPAARATFHATGAGLKIG